MTLHTSDLHRLAEETLSRVRYSPKKLVLIHTGISLGASLFITLINFLFSQMIASTGGLSGMSTRNVLETAQAMLELAVMVALPFWEIGLIRAVLCWIKGESAEPPTLLEGFRRFGAVISLKLMTGILFLVIGMAAANISSILFMLTPFSGKLTDILVPIIEESDNSADGLLSGDVLSQLGSAIIPALVIFAIVFAAIAIPVFYRTRFADFAVMEGNRALISILESFRITKGSAWQVAKVDLSFWWFYLLQGLSVALCYGDTLLNAAGIVLPIPPDAAYFLFFAAGLVCQLVLLWQYQAKVSATYGLVYDTLHTPFEQKLPVENSQL